MTCPGRSSHSHLLDRPHTIQRHNQIILRGGVIMANIKSRPCKLCQSTFHTAAFCPTKPRKAIKRTAIKRDFLPTSVKNEVSGKSAPIKKKRKVKTDRQKAKEQAWAAFSYYIRIRDSLATTGTTDSCVCVTCNERGDTDPKPFNKIQAGHGVGGRGNAVLFHEDIVNGQCSYCNTKAPIGLGGDYGNYALFFVKKYGLEKAEEFQRLRHQTKVYKTFELIEVKELYIQKVKELLG